MPKLSDYSERGATRTVEVGQGEGALHVTYRPAVITPRFQKAMVAAMTANDVDGGLLWPMSELIAEWDLTDDDGAPIPTTPDGLAEVPVRGLMAILEAITGNEAPNRQSAEPSRNGSTPAASSAPAQTGI